MPRGPGEKKEKKKPTLDWAAQAGQLKIKNETSLFHEESLGGSLLLQHSLCFSTMSHLGSNILWENEYIC